MAPVARLPDDLDCDRRQLRELAAQLRRDAQRLRAYARQLDRCDGVWTLRGMQQVQAKIRHVKRLAADAGAQAKRVHREAVAETQIIRDARLLGLTDRYFTRDEVRVAFKRRAFAEHPDRHPVRRRLRQTRLMVRLESAERRLLATLRQPGPRTGVSVRQPARARPAALPQPA